MGEENIKNVFMADNILRYLSGSIIRSFVYIMSNLIEAARINRRDLSSLWQKQKLAQATYGFSEWNCMYFGIIKIQEGSNITGG